MSINLVIYYPEGEPEEYDFYPFSSVSRKSMWNTYWKPLVKEHNLQWLELMESVGIPFYNHMDKISEIRKDFQALYDLTENLNDVDIDYKNRMLSRIELVLQVIDKILADPGQFTKVSIG